MQVDHLKVTRRMCIHSAHLICLLCAESDGPAGHCKDFVIYSRNGELGGFADEHHDKFKKDSFYF